MFSPAAATMETGEASATLVSNAEPPPRMEEMGQHQERQLQRRTAVRGSAMTVDSSTYAPPVRDVSDIGNRNFELFCRQAFEAFDVEQNGLLTFEDFMHLYESVRNRWPWAMHVPDWISDQYRGKDSKAAANAVRAAKVADNAAREFELLNLDELAMLRIFKLFDKDKSGYLDAGEIRSIAMEMGIPDYERDKYQGFIKRNSRIVDDDGSGLVEFEEFKRLLQSLVTCKVDRNYRQYILAHRLPGDAAIEAVQARLEETKKSEPASPKRKGGKRVTLQA